MVEDRYFLRLQYHGAAFHGWQKQPNALAVQAVLEKALSTLLGKPTEVIGAGRTDTGVHAAEMFAHFDAPEGLDLEQMTFRLNAFLPESIAILAVHPVVKEAHARFSALARTYEYHIHWRKDVFLNDRSWYVRQRPDLEALQAAASLMLQFDEFSAFARSNDAAAHHRCDLMQSVWEHQNDRSLYRVKANRFLRNMVRAMVGTMMKVGRGKMPLEQLSAIIASGDRKQAGESAPPQGLFLTRVEYPEAIFSCQT